MRDADCGDLLRLVAATAAEGRDLVPALEAAGGHGPALARELRRGHSLVEALGRTLTPLQRWLLLGPRPELAESALLCADLIDLARDRRRTLVIRLAYPVVVLLLIGTIALLAGDRLGNLAWAPAPLALGGALLAAVLVSVLVPGRWVAALPWLAPWRAHGHRAWTYRALAIGVRHRLDEDRLRQCFGPLPEQLLRLCATADAPAWCVRMARWHQQRAQRHLLLVCMIAAAGLFLVAGSLVLGIHTGLLQQQLELLPTRTPTSAIDSAP